MNSVQIPCGTYKLDIGESFFNHSFDGHKSAATSTSMSNSQHSTEFSTLRFDFKPKSLASETAYIAFEGSEDAQVIIPKEKTVNEIAGVSKTEEEFMIFKGARKVIKGDKECLLTFDHTTNVLQLERLTSNIAVKKTRGDFDSKLREEIQCLRKKKDQQQNFRSEPISNGITVVKYPTAIKLKQEAPKIAPRKEKPASFSSSSSSPADSPKSSPKKETPMPTTTNNTNQSNRRSCSSEMMESTSSTLVKTGYSKPSTVSGTETNAKSAILKMDLELSTSESDSD